MTTTPSLLRSASHVTFESVTAEQLSGIGAITVLSALDNGLIGPCRPDPEEHRRARLAYWGRADDEGEEVRPSEIAALQTPVVVWASRSLRQRVNLWRLCNWLRRAGIAAGDVHVLSFERVAPMRPRTRPLPPFDCSPSVSHYADEVLIERLNASSPVSKDHFDRAATLWELYTGEDPTPFVNVCLQGEDGFPEVGPVWKLLGSFFPRRTADNGVRLSRLDELLLHVLTGDLQTPAAVYNTRSSVAEELSCLLSCTGDLYVERRLAEWSRHGPLIAVEREDRPNPGHPMQSSAYRITEHGLHLCANGVNSLSNAPPLFVGGTSAYTTPPGWLLQEDGRLTRS